MAIRILLTVSDALCSRLGKKSGSGAAQMAITVILLIYMGMSLRAPGD